MFEWFVDLFSWFCSRYVVACSDYYRSARLCVPTRRRTRITSICTPVVCSHFFYYYFNYYYLLVLILNKLFIKTYIYYSFRSWMVFGPSSLINVVVIWVSTKHGYIVIIKDHTGRLPLLYCVVYYLFNLFSLM